MDPPHGKTTLPEHRIRRVQGRTRNQSGREEKLLLEIAPELGPYVEDLKCKRRGRPRLPCEAIAAFRPARDGGLERATDPQPTGRLSTGASCSISSPSPTPAPGRSCMARRQLREPLAVDLEQWLESRYVGQRAFDLGVRHGRRWFLLGWHRARLAATIRTSLPECMLEA